MTWHNKRTEEEVDLMIEDMKRRSKGNYITQGVSFNKTCPRQMEWLKKALMSSASFSGLAKELLAVKFSGGVNYSNPPVHITPRDLPKTKNIGNFV